METDALEAYDIYDVSSGHGSQVYLIVGSEKTAVIDSGMAYSAPGLIRNIRNFLEDRPLDYIVLTHSHYDHASGIPALRNAWPGVQVYAAAYAKHVFESEKAKKLMTELNMDACTLYHGEGLNDYDADMLCVNHILSEGSQIFLGNHTITAYETPGHTRCSISYMLDELVLFASETTGVVTPGWGYSPNYLVSYSAAVKAVHKCASLPVRYVAIPHTFICDLNERPDFWAFCLQEMESGKEFILKLYEEGASLDNIVENFVLRYRDDLGRKEQPLKAFVINARSMIGAVLREFKEV